MICNICGSDKFEPGPSGRMAASGQLPQCAECKSVERHRAMRRFFSRLGPERMRAMRALQFGSDGSLDSNWFASHEGSFYGGGNSIDVQQIDRPDGCYDFIFLSHVIDAVPDDRRAMSELARILSADGVLTICFGSVGNKAKTQSRAPNPWASLRRYGVDRFEWLGTAELGLIAIEVHTTDPATGVEEGFDLFVKSPTALNFVLQGEGRMVSPHHYWLTCDDELLPVSRK